MSIKMIYQQEGRDLAKKTWGIIGIFCGNGELLPHKQQVVE